MFIIPGGIILQYKCNGRAGNQATVATISRRYNKLAQRFTVVELGTLEPFERESPGGRPGPGGRRDGAGCPAPDAAGPSLTAGVGGPEGAVCARPKQMSA